MQPLFSPSPIAAAALLTAVAAGTPAAVYAEVPAVPATVGHPTAEANAKATALLTHTAETLQKVSRLRADFETVALTGPYRDTRETGTVRLARPGGIRVELDRFRRKTPQDAWEQTGNGSLAVHSLTSDGDESDVAHLLTRHPQSTQYRRVEKPRLETLLGSLEPVLQGFFAEAGQKLRTEDTAALYLGEQEWEGTRYSLVETSAPDGARSTLYIHPEDGLVHRVRVERAGSAGKRIVREVFLRNVRLEKDAARDTQASNFTFTPPDDTVPVAAARPRRGTADGASVTLAPGTPAPDFLVEDAAGKPVRLSEVTRGQVTVLKFWATWCWSCKQSLPGTERLAASLSGKDGVAVFAVALWDSRKAFRSWTQEKAERTPHIRFAFDPAPQGEDAGSRLYHVSATPTAFVIGRDGRIAAVITGYAGPSSTALEDAVRRALDQPIAASTETSPHAGGTR